MLRKVLFPLILLFALTSSVTLAFAEESTPPPIPEEWGYHQDPIELKGTGLSFADDVIITGPDIRVLLRKIIPALDDYTLRLVEQIEGIRIRNENGDLFVEVRFNQERSVLPIREYKKAKRGDPYEVRFAKNFSFHLTIKRDTMRIRDIEGIVLMVRIPVLPDGIYPTELFLDSSRELVDISALAVNGHVALEGSVNVRLKQFTGIDWKKTIRKNWHFIFSVFKFLRY